MRHGAAGAAAARTVFAAAAGCRFGVDMAGAVTPLCHAASTNIELVIERVRRVHVARQVAGDVDTITGGLRGIGQLRSWLAASEAELRAQLTPKVAFPEKDLAEATRCSLGEATKASERSETLGALPGFAGALDDATVTPAHVDEITKKAKGLTDDQRAEFHERVAALVPVAAAGSVRDFGKRLDHERRAVERSDGMEKLARQRSKIEFRDWTDADGMYCYAGRLDPLSAVTFRARIDREMRRLFAEGRARQRTCRSDPGKTAGAPTWRISCPSARTITR